MGEIKGFDIDMSSDEPHVNVLCPICGDRWIQKVIEGEHETKCKCKMKYKIITIEETGQVEIKFTINHYQ